MTDRPARRVALLVEEDFEDRDVAGAAEALRAAGLEVVIVGPVMGTTYKGRRGEVSVAADAAAGKTRQRDAIRQVFEAAPRPLAGGPSGDLRRLVGLLGVFMARMRAQRRAELAASMGK